MLLSRITYPGKEHSLGQIFLEYMTYNLTLAFSEKEPPIKNHALPIYSVFDNKQRAGKKSFLLVLLYQHHLNTCSKQQRPLSLRLYLRG